jgi:hypothetical protein
MPIGLWAMVETGKAPFMATLYPQAFVRHPKHRSLIL